MFLKFGLTIINLDHITSIKFRGDDITIYMVDGTSATMDIAGADELEKRLAEYNKKRGYKNDQI